MKISIASDHGGYDLKEDLRTWLTEQGHEVVDFGCHGHESCDYADFCAPAARAVAEGTCERGIVICTTGIGASITANKVRGVRCALCCEPWSAQMTRRHNNSNVLAMGAGCVGPLMARQIVEAFLTFAFEGGRHQRRIDKIASVENEA
jgi:ribose 5-phosphate isomerase B